MQHFGAIDEEGRRMASIEPAAIYLGDVADEIGLDATGIL